MKKRIVPLLKYLIFLGIGVFLIWWSLHHIPKEKWGEFKRSLQTANYYLIIPVFLILSASHMVRALRWKVLMQPMGYHPRISNTFFAVMIGYLANLAVPRLGEVLKCTILARYEKVPAEKLVGTIVAERAVDVLSLAIIFLLAMITQYDVVGEYGSQLLKQLFENSTGHFSWIRVAVVIGILAAIVVAIRIWFRQFSHLQVVILAKKILKGIWEGLLSIRNLQRKWAFLAYTATIWILYIGGTWIGFMATEGTTGLGMQHALSALAFASIGMIITPGGIGAYAYFIAAVLEKNNIPFEIGFANGTLQWFAQFIIVLLVGSLCLILLPLYNKKKTHESS
ncbi:lysylphosphatidylglycerol synthase transmembrane domain-containing protein [Sediminibacterium soli]|uniref:lysylphosphatidylglycerol synthase transmembrane domain-containing protein n=1 Tax=Sediminibacterium soli TaxID=2698829 RepID=UPI00137A1B08|nr:lysylphosphatidylglycerol synthase transmembrane domain-containing protein [Sediminibacterium soli]NCI45843.1 flippase-like domain-containing protein [Sediminibacterium soli]